MVSCENQMLHPAFFRRAIVCIEANSTTSCSLCFQSLCRHCVRENNHVCHYNTYGDEAHVPKDAQAMVTWIINRLHAANKYIGTIQNKKTGYNLGDLLSCKGNAGITDAACLYFGRLFKSGQKFVNLLESVHVGKQRTNSKLQLILSSDSNFDPLCLITAIMEIVQEKETTLQEVIGPGCRLCIASHSLAPFLLLK